MASNWSRPFQLTYPLNARQVEEIDSMFQKLFSKLPLNVNRGGTGQDFADLAIGDLLYGDVEADGVTPKFSLLADVAVGSYLRSGGLLTAPLWSTLKLPNAAAVGDILIADTLDTITGLAIGAAGTIIRSNGTIPANSGFTIPNTFATGNVLYASATNVVSGLAIGATGNFMRWSGTVPTWSTLTIVNQGATGGILHTSTTDNATFLAIGTVGKILRSTGTLPAWTTLTVPNTATTGGILHASATDVTTFLAIGSAGKLIRSTGTLPAYSTFTIPDTFALGDVVYGSATNVLTALAGNITTTQKFLSQTGTGTVSAAPSWQLVPAVGSLVFFFKKTASSIATYFEMSTPASVAAAQTIVSGTLTTGTSTLANFATVAGVPNVTFVPGGVATCYVTAKQDATVGSKTAQLFAEFYQRDTGGTETLLATSAQTINLTASDAAYIFQGAIPASVVFVASDRLVTRVRVVIAGAGSDLVITLTIEGTTAARSESPSATVDATNFLPYTGATANVNTGLFTLTTTSLSFGSSVILADTTDVVGIRNGANSQKINIYNHFTDASNYMRWVVSGNASGGSPGIYVEGAGSGVNPAFHFGQLTSGTGAVVLWTAGIQRWTWLAAGDLLAFADNAYDIGASLATRPRTGYFATSLIQGGALNLGTTSTDGILLQNTTAATSGVPVQQSPRVRFRSQVWNTTAVAATNTNDWFIESVPVSGLVPSGLFKIGSSLNGGGSTFPLTLSSAGRLDISGFIVGASTVFGNSLEVSNTGSYVGWSGRSRFFSPANGQINFNQEDSSTGTGIDVNTDAVMKIRTRAQTGYATLDCLGLKASGVAGASFGPGAVTSITVVNGIVTAIS
jgi:hypothetical protein